MTPAEIKFRGFRTDGKGWVEGLLLKSPDGKEFGIQWYDNNVRHIADIHPSSLGMFTGETDKNGREIFGAIGEKGGDRCKFIVEICGLGECVDINIEGVVVFENGSFVLNHHEPDIPNNVFVSDFIDNAEIIGNQWEADNGR